MTKKSHWPCPNRCLDWCRTDSPRGPKPNHHPNCEHYNASLIDVWFVNIQGTGYVTDSLAGAKKELSRLIDDDHECGARIDKQKMHREVYEQLEEFGGF